MEKQSWEEFLRSCDFSCWKMTCIEEGAAFVKEYSISDLLDNPDVEYNSDTHIVDWGEPVEITNFEEDCPFWIVWERIREGEYEAYPRCFFSEEEAEEFMKKSVREV